MWPMSQLPAPSFASAKPRQQYEQDAVHVSGIQQRPGPHVWGSIGEANSPACVTACEKQVLSCTWICRDRPCPSAPWCSADSYSLTCLALSPRLRSLIHHLPLSLSTGFLILIFSIAACAETFPVMLREGPAAPKSLQSKGI